MSVSRARLFHPASFPVHFTALFFVRATLARAAHVSKQLHYTPRKYQLHYSLLMSTSSKNKATLCKMSLPVPRIAVQVVSEIRISSFADCPRYISIYVPV